MESFTKIVIAIVVFFIVLFGATVTLGNWDLSKVRNEKTVEISGELTSKDGSVKYFPERMDIDHQGISIIIRYKIEDEIENLGFDYTYSNPRFWLEKNPKYDPEGEEGLFPINYRDNTVMPTHVNKEEDSVGEYFEVYYSYSDVPHYDEDATYRLYLSNPGYLTKKISEEHELKIGQSSIIEFENIGSYEVRLRIDESGDQMKLYKNLQTRSFIGNSLRVHDRIKGVINGREVPHGGGSGSGSRSGGSSTYTSQGEYKIDRDFANADSYIVKIYSVNLNLDSFPPHREVYLDF